MKKHVLAMTGIIVAVSLAFSPVTLTAADKWPHTITVGSFVKASASYPTNVALAKLITKYTPANGVVREYAGGAPGIEALARGDIDTWSQGQNDFYNAYLGQGFWKGKPKDLRLLIGAWYLGPFGLGLSTMLRYRHVVDPVNTARECKSGTVKSGAASAGGVAPDPERP